MNQWWAFTKKEWLETWRTRRLLLLLVIFIAFGIMNPLVAKLTPEIMRLSFGEEFPVLTPTAFDSWTQFYKNISQIGIYLFAIIFSGTVSQEMNQGTFINLVTKGMRRSLILASKALVLYAQWFLALVVSFGITYGYTVFYFPDKASPHPWVAFFPVLLFGIFFMNLILLTSTIARSQFEGLLLTILVLLFGYLLAWFDQLKEWHPFSLIGQNLGILEASTNFNQWLPSIGLTIVLGIGCFFLSVLILNRKKI
ncbi:ABC transporter permease subunit [Enterococcus sp. LJL98]